MVRPIKQTQVFTVLMQNSLSKHFYKILATQAVQQKIY